MGKTLILIRGFHYKNLNNTGPINWKICYQSFLKKIIKFIGDYDLYFQTYDSPELDNLNEKYKPIKFISYPSNESHKYNQTQNIYKLFEIVDNINQYDRIFITRFDVLYKIPFDRWNLKKNHVNVFFYHPKKQGFNDIIFLLHPNNLMDFKEKIKNCNLNYLHHIEFENLHALTDSRYYSDTDYPEFFPLNNNPYYVLLRIRMWGFKNKTQAFYEAKRQGFINKYL